MRRRDGESSALRHRQRQRHVINPAVVDGQIYGSAAHGISVALGEGFVYGPDGQLLTLTLLDYGKSTTLETPHIEVEHYPVPCPFTTFGQKAAGEGAAIPSPAAIASAVEDALPHCGDSRFSLCPVPMAPDPRSHPPPPPPSASASLGSQIILRATPSGGNSCTRGSLRGVNVGGHRTFRPTTPPNN